MESEISIGLFFKRFVGSPMAHARAWRHLKPFTLYLASASFVTILTGCVTSYYPYSGVGIYQGQGGASKTVDGIDIWLVGTPPRKFQIIGYVEDSRPGGPIPMARRNPDLAAMARSHGGDAVLFNADQSQLAAVSSFSTVSAVQTGNFATATGTGMSVPIIRREGRFYVIKYVE